MPDVNAWNLRYEFFSAPWDMGEPHPELIRRLDEDPSLGTGSVGSVLVPGSGLGNDAAALAAAGWRVTALDFAPALEAGLVKILEPLGGSVVIGDAFEFNPDRAV